MLCERLLKRHSHIILVTKIMASMIQLCLASISVGRRPNKSFPVQPCNTNVALSHVNYSSKSKSNARELSVAATAMKSSLFATKSKKNQDWRVWCNYQESPEASIKFFLIKFFHAINGDTRDDFENCLALECVFEDAIFQNHSGRKDTADFICKLKDALGPRIRIHLEAECVKVEPEGIAENRWVATVPWHLEWIDVSTYYDEEAYRPRWKISSSHVTSYFEIEKSRELYIRKIIGINRLQKAAEFKQVTNSLYAKISNMSQLEQLKAARVLYENFSHQALAMGLLIPQDDDDDCTDELY